MKIQICIEDIKLCLLISIMSDIPQSQDSIVEKIHQEENLDDENNYDMEETLGDSDLSEEEEEEEEQSTPP